MMKRIFCTTLLLTATISCTTTSEQAASGDVLDIELKKIAAHKKAETEATEKEIGVTIPATAIVEWQRFFKPAPSTEQRRLLEKRLVSSEPAANLEELVQKGRNEVALGRYVAAEATFRQSLAKDSEHKETLQEMSQLYLRMHNATRAFEYLAQLKRKLESMPQKNPVDVFRYRYTLAMAYLEQQETTKAHKILSDLIALDKTFTPGYAALASSYIKLGKHSVAEFIAKRGLDRGAEDASLYNALGVVAKHNGDEAGARTYFNRALSLTPTYIPAIVNRANMHIESRDFDAAESDLKQAIKLAPSNTNVLVSLGSVEKKMGRYDAAQASFSKAIEIDPENATARFNLAVVTADQFKKPNQALRLFHEVLQTPGTSQELQELAKLYIDDLRDQRESER